MPFSMTNPIGFLVAYSFEFVICWIVCKSCVYALGLFGGLSEWLITLVKDIKYDLLSFDGSNNNLAPEQLKEFVNKHSNAKQLSRNENTRDEKMKC